LVNDQTSRSNTACPSHETDELDGYLERLARVKLPLARRAEASSVRLVWLIAGLSVPSGRAAVGDYVCALGSREIARRAHLPLEEATDALNALLDAGRLELQQGCPEARYRLRLDFGRYRTLGEAERL
jgi:hypothetical protein